MKRILLISVILAALIALIGCSSPQGQSPMKFEKIGQKGLTVFLTLTSPSQVTDEELGNRLKTDWQNNLVNGRIEVMVFDNKEAPQRWLELWEIQLYLSNADWAKEQAQIYPHHIATYARIEASGENRCIFFARDAQGTVVKQIKY